MTTPSPPAGATVSDGIQSHPNAFIVHLWFFISQQPEAEAKVLRSWRSPLSPALVSHVGLPLCPLCSPQEDWALLAPVSAVSCHLRIRGPGLWEVENACSRLTQRRGKFLFCG